MSRDNGHETTDATWREQALCTQMDPELWFPEVGENPRQAKLICSWCEVRSDCLAFALRANEQHGVWGGLSPWERNRLRREFVAGSVDEHDGEAA